jgi:topoisomerase-4 subunit B
MLKFFMGKNTPERQEYIIRNLRFELDLAEDEAEKTEEEPKQKISQTKEESTAVKSEAA